MVTLSHFDMQIYATHMLKLGMHQRRRKGMIIHSHFDKTYATHQLKLGMDQRREKEGMVILSHFDMHIYVTHFLIKERREKGAIILKVILAHLCNSPSKVGNGREKRKRGSGYS